MRKIRKKDLQNIYPNRFKRIKLQCFDPINGGCGYCRHHVHESLKWFIRECLRFNRRLKPSFDADYGINSYIYIDDKNFILIGDQVERIISRLSSIPTKIPILTRIFGG